MVPTSRASTSEPLAEASTSGHQEKQTRPTAKVWNDPKDTQDLIDLEIVESGKEPLSSASGVRGLTWRWILAAIKGTRGLGRTSFGTYSDGATISAQRAPSSSKLSRRACRQERRTGIPLFKAGSHSVSSKRYIRFPGRHTLNVPVVFAKRFAPGKPVVKAVDASRLIGGMKPGENAKISLLRVRASRAAISSSPSTTNRHQGDGTQALGGSCR